MLISDSQLSNGSLAAVEVHMNGLERMVNMRGGVNCSNFSPALRRVVLW
jgi:hypothetical protein